MSPASDRAATATSTRPHPVGLVLFAATAFAVGLALAVSAVQLNTEPWGWTWVLAPVAGLVHVGAGVLAWVRRPRNHMGPLLCVGGLLWFATSGAALGIPFLLGLSLVTQTTPLAFVVHALLAYPSGRLRGAASWTLTAAIYVTALVLQAPLYLFRTLGEEPPVLWVDARPDLVQLDRVVQAVAGLAILFATAVVLVLRLRAADRRHRRVLIPVYATGIAVVLLVTTVHLLLNALALFPPAVNELVQIGLVCLVPVAFVIGVLLGGFERTGELDELAERLGSGGARPDLEEAVARTLGDHSVRLAYRFGDRWVDGDGVALEPPQAGGGRGVSVVELDGRAVGAISYDALLIPDPGPVQAAGRVVAIALDRQRLTAQLLASQEELRESRTRLVEAGDQERRRLAQDLHDRLQGRLILLALRVGNARPGDDLGPVRQGLDESITELRWLVQGVMPALLLERGLAAAVEDLADRMPIRTSLDVTTDGDDDGSRRLPASVEGTAYAVIAEALTNAVKHSSASLIRVALTEEAGVLRVEVVDDGVGGARSAGGFGLRGMTDRVQALGGQLHIESPDRAGTRVLAELPCAS